MVATSTNAQQTSSRKWTFTVIILLLFSLITS